MINKITYLTSIYAEKLINKIEELEKDNLLLIFNIKKLKKIKKKKIEKCQFKNLKLII